MSSNPPNTLTSIIHQGMDFLGTFSGNRSVDTCKFLMRSRIGNVLLILKHVQIWLYNVFRFAFFKI